MRAAAKTAVYHSCPSVVLCISSTDWCITVLEWNLLSAAHRINNINSSNKCAAALRLISSLVVSRHNCCLIRCARGLETSTRLTGCMVCGLRWDRTLTLYQSPHVDIPRCEHASGKRFLIEDAREELDEVGVFLRGCYSQWPHH